MSCAPFLTTWDTHDDLMAMPTISSLIQMLCVMIKTFCGGYSSPADGDAFGNAEQIEIEMIYSAKVHRRKFCSVLLCRSSERGQSFVI